MMEIPDLLPSRLNFDAVVFCGCTMKEMQLIALISLIVCILFLGLLSKLLIHMFLIGMGLAFPTAVGMSWGLALIFQRAKQGKPKGYVKQCVLLGLEKYKLIAPVYCRVSGKWSVGRYLK
jgi:conjugative transfer region protein (TIGR03750 family)